VYFYTLFYGNHFDGCRFVYFQ
ncbi:hypothetical protein AZ014_000911, partial [Klebsiella pneumoniae]